MAQHKGLIYRLTMGKDNLPDFQPNKLPGSRWAVFKDVFFNRIGALVKINLLCLVACIPAIIWCFWVYMSKKLDAMFVPYSSNIGIGYPVIDNAIQIGQLRNFSYNIQQFIFLIPCLMIAFVGFAGAFYVLKRLAWGEGIGVASHFFYGIKTNWSQFLWIGLIDSVSLLLLMFNIGSYNIIEVHVAFKIISIALSVLQFMLVMMMSIFLCTQAVTYKLKLLPLIKNSFLFAIALFPQNIFFLALSAIPLLIIFMLPPIFAMFGWIFFVFLGFSYIFLIWTVFSHYVFDKFVNDRIKGAVKNRGMYVKSEAETQEEKERQAKDRNVHYNNANWIRNMSSIDEGSTFTPLESNFSRADLAKLKEEKAVIVAEIEAERQALDNEAEEARKAQEEAEAATKKKGKKKNNLNKKTEETNNNSNGDVENK